MPNYAAPGIYIQEVSTGARPIQPVGTSTAGFVGIAPNVDARVNEAIPIESWEHFLRVFGERAAEPVATPPPPKPADGPTGPAAASPSTTVKPKPASPGVNDPDRLDLARAVHGFFLNGGSRCYVVNIGANGSLTGDDKKRSGLDLLEPVDEIAIVAAPGFSSKSDHDSLLSHCEKETLQDRVAILDPPRTFENADVLRNARPRSSDRGFGAFYAPYLLVHDVFNPRNREGVAVPPSGHMAGIWARTDATRGVHKAPANETVRGAIGLTYNVTRAEQEMLNPDGINCIRLFAREGVRVWGARTLANKGSEWTYVNVRRLFNMIEESIAQSTRWTVFEPNDEPLWKAIRRDVSSFLRVLWRDGALQGATPDEAFFVKCDRDTNTQDDIDLGRVVTLIGIAPVKPAEFIIFRIGQHAAGTDRAPAGA